MLSDRIMDDVLAYGDAREQLGRAKADLEEQVHQNSHSDYGAPDIGREALFRESVSAWEKIVADKAENVGISISTLATYFTGKEQ